MKHQHFSTYLRMPDGVSIAIDAYTPPGPGPFPTMLSPTRYYRALESRTRVGRRIAAALAKTRNAAAAFVAAGYAWLDIDVRGSGASSGVRHCPWSPDEIDDLVAVLDWVVQQRWCDGRIGATGTSYVGTACEMLATRGHPALKAIAPHYGVFDVVPDVIAPGGVPQRWFIGAWSRINSAFDRGDFHDVLAQTLRYSVEALVDGVRDPRVPDAVAALRRVPPERVEDTLARLVKLLQIGVRGVERDVVALSNAIAEHADNYNIESQALRLIFRDTLLSETDHFLGHPFWRGAEGTADHFSPHSHMAALRDTDVPVYSLSGWSDGAYTGSAIKRFMNIDTPGSTLILGPWEHGGNLNTSPWSPHLKNRFDHSASQLAFFDRHLKDDPSAPPDPVRYCVMGAEPWKPAPSWPPPAQPPRLYLADNGTLRPTAPTADASPDRHRLPTDSTTGRASRWRSFIGPNIYIGYPDRAAQTRDLPSYRSPALEEDTEITGHPIAHLHLSSEAPDGDLFVYLEEERGGRVTYITEGLLRLAHRAVADERAPYRAPEPYRTLAQRDARPMRPGAVELVRLALLPVSYLARRGSRLRLTLAGADRDSFGEPLPLGAIALHRSARHPSWIELPVCPAQG